MVVGDNSELREKIAFLHNAVGAIQGPFDSFLALRGLKTLGSWNCGLLFCRPHVVQPVTPCSVRPPAKRGSVGRPLMP